MVPKMKPALSKEEWTGVRDWRPDVAPEMIRRFSPGDHDRQACALLLHGQTFGFTRGDVTAIRDVVRVEGPENYRALVALADRIEAFLPPEPSEP